MKGCSDGPEAGHSHFDARIVVVCTPIKICFKTGHQVPELVVGAELERSDEETFVVWAAERQTEEIVGHLAMCPSSSNVAAKAPSGPAERRRHIGWRSWWWWRLVPGRSAASAPIDIPTNAASDNVWSSL